MASERNGLTSCGIVAARGLGMGRTYSVGAGGSIAGVGATGTSAGLVSEAADFAKLFDCNPVTEERSRVEGPLSAGCEFGTGTVATSHLGTIPSSGPVYGTNRP